LIGDAAAQRMFQEQHDRVNPREDTAFEFVQAGGAGCSSEAGPGLQSQLPALLYQKKQKLANLCKTVYNGRQKRSIYAIIEQTPRYPARMRCPPLAHHAGNHEAGP
jgi:hypothetical protein